MRRPVVGVCAAIEQARWGNWDTLVLLSPRKYSLAVQRAGALALILAPDEATVDDPEQQLDLLDALLLAGGSDIDPASYGEAPQPGTRPSLPGRDSFEIALARAALERDMPLLGVCRGMQLLNVALGGTLEQHIANLELHRHTPGAFGDHEVELEPGSLAARAAGAERLVVKSHHHQGIDRLGEGLVVTGHALPDGLVEAVELPERRFALGALWHPEEDERGGPITALVDAARASLPA